MTNTPHQVNWNLNNISREIVDMAEQGNPKPEDNSEKEITFRNVQLLKNETLGTGSYGLVCKAKCDQLICAAKLIFSVLFQIQAPEPGKEHRQPFHRFEQECQFLSQVNHPNIVQYLGTYRDPETNAPVLLMELMDESLTHFLESSPGDIPYHIQVKLSQDIAQALAFLHTNGIIHRDLSSNNVLLIAGSRAKVSDFGMSKFADINVTRLATLTQCPGTPAFMSPEALDEPPLYTEKLDNFSFGVILIQVMTQKFPKPRERFEKKQFSDSQHPLRKINAKVLIPEVERRQAHISLIEPTHPLLPIALECLNDEADERPSSQQLCQSLDALKTTLNFEQSQQQADVILFQQKEEKQQLPENDQPIQVNHQTFGHEIEAKQRQLEAKDEAIKIKDNTVVAKEQEVQSLQHDIEYVKHQLRKLNEQLESNEETTAILQNTIFQRDQEIAELREIPATLQQTITQQDREIVELREQIEHNRVGTSQHYISMSWESLSYSASQFAPTSAVVGDEVYLSSLSDFHIWQFTLSLRQLKKFFKHVLRDFSLVNIENELTTVGGCCSESWRITDSNKLYSYTEGEWVEKYPPMPTKRCKCASEYSHNMLIVAGGQQNTGDSRVPSRAVEILNIDSMQWSQPFSVGFSTSWPSISFCGEYVHISTGQRICPIVWCHLLYSIPLPGPGSVNWKEIASLPVEGFTLVTIKGHLVAVGGKSIAEKRNVSNIHQYNPLTNQWQVINRMKVARSECAAALVQNNKLIVVGGTSKKEPIEVASIF